MYLHGYYSSTNPQKIVENTAFEIDVSQAAMLPDTDPLSIRMLHAIDFNRIFLEK